MNVAKFLAEHPNRVVASFWGEVQRLEPKYSEVFWLVVNNFPSDESYMGAHQIAWLLGGAIEMRKNAVGDLEARCLSLEKLGKSLFERYAKERCFHQSPSVRKDLLSFYALLAGILGDYGVRCLFDALESKPTKKLTQKDIEELTEGDMEKDNPLLLRISLLEMLTRLTESAPVEEIARKADYVGVQLLLEANMLIAKAVDEGLV